ncbi:MAG: 4Fe-4S double cluster binding domain-containing protein [Christensenellales bacterium]
MDGIKLSIEEKAQELGFDGVFFVSKEGFDIGDSGLKNPEDVLLGTRCVILLIKRYRLYAFYPDGVAPYSPYYFSSNAGYHGAAGLAQYIRDAGFDAVSSGAIPQKAALQRAGADIGLNTLAYMEGIGSLFSISSIVTDACGPLEYEGKKLCAGCGRCVKSCPVGALGDGADINNCIRAAMNNPFFDGAARDKMAKILGCDICQQVCPLNKEHIGLPDKDEANMFCYSSLLSGEASKTLRRFIGRNMAGRRRLLSQGAVCAANNGHSAALADIGRLTLDNDAAVAFQASWAKERLGAKGKSGH